MYPLSSQEIVKNLYDQCNTLSGDEDAVQAARLGLFVLRGSQACAYQQKYLLDWLHNIHSPRFAIPENEKINWQTFLLDCMKDPEGSTAHKILCACLMGQLSGQVNPAAEEMAIRLLSDLDYSRYSQDEWEALGFSISPMRRSVLFSQLTTQIMSNLSTDSQLTKGMERAFHAGASHCPREQVNQFFTLLTGSLRVAPTENATQVLRQFDAQRTSANVQRQVSALTFLARLVPSCDKMQAGELLSIVEGYLKNANEDLRSQAWRTYVALAKQCDQTYVAGALTFCGHLLTDNEVSVRNAASHALMSLADRTDPSEALHLGFKLLSTLTHYYTVDQKTIENHARMRIDIDYWPLHEAAYHTFKTLATTCEPSQVSELIDHTLPYLQNNEIKLKAAACLILEALLPKSPQRAQDIALIEVLSQLLDSENWGLRVAATRALGVLVTRCEPTKVPALFDKLRQVLLSNIRCVQVLNTNMRGRPIQSLEMSCGQAEGKVLSAYAEHCEPAQVEHLADELRTILASQVSGLPESACQALRPLAQQLGKQTRNALVDALQPLLIRNVEVQRDAVELLLVLLPDCDQAQITTLMSSLQRAMSTSRDLLAILSSVTALAPFADPAQAEQMLPAFRRHLICNATQVMDDSSQAFLKLALRADKHGFSELLDWMRDKATNPPNSFDSVSVQKFALTLGPLAPQFTPQEIVRLHQLAPQDPSISNMWCERYLNFCLETLPLLPPELRKQLVESAQDNSFQKLALTYMTETLQPLAEALENRRFMLCN